MPLVVVGETGLIGSAIKSKNVSNTLNFFINEWTTENVAISLRNLTTEWEITKRPIDLVWAAGKSNNSSNQATLDFEINIVESFLKNLSNSGLELNSLSLISSAGSIFGGYDDELISNNTLPKPISLYGKSRLEIESKFADYANENRMSLNIFRLTNVFGFKQTLKNGSGLLSHLISANLTRKELNIFVPLYVEQDYIDVDFVSQNLINILEKSKSPEKLINNYIFSRNQSHSIAEVIALIDKFMGRKTPFVTQQIDSGFERQSNLRFQVTNDSFITKHIEQITISVKKLVNKMIHSKVS
jgi:nucleoside-diphosphate-sugar epimerase